MVTQNRIMDGIIVEIGIIIFLPTLALYPKPRGQSQEKRATMTMEQNKNDDSKQNHQSFYIPNTIFAKTKNLLMT